MTSPEAIAPFNESPADHEHVSPGETDPVKAGMQVVELFNDSAKDYVEACVLISCMSELYAQSSREFTAFIDVLVEAKIISQREGNRGAQSGKLSKLRKIGENRDLLLRPRVIRCVELGYTVAYQACLLHEALPGTPEEKDLALVSTIEGAEDLSKEFLISETAKIRGETDADTGSGLSSLKSDEDRSKLELSNLTEIDGILATPSRQDIRLFGDTYTDEGMLFRCLPVHERVAEDAAIVVIAKVADVPAIVTRLLPCCGFKRITHVLLLRQPPSSEVTDADVAIIAHRGEVQSLFLTEWTWLEGDAAVDSISIANRVLINAESRVHIFASAETEGWQSLIGDAVWAEKPSLK